SNDHPFIRGRVCRIWIGDVIRLSCRDNVGGGGIRRLCALVVVPEHGRRCAAIASEFQVDASGQSALGLHHLCVRTLFALEYLSEVARCRGKHWLFLNFQDYEMWGKMTAMLNARLAKRMALLAALVAILLNCGCQSVPPRPPFTPFAPPVSGGVR